MSKKRAVYLSHEPPPAAAGAENVVVKAATQNNNTTTYAQVTDLTFTAGANETWVFEFHVPLFFDEVGDSQWRVVCAPAAGGGSWLRYAAVFFNAPQNENAYSDTTGFYASMLGTNLAGVDMVHNTSGFAVNDQSHLIIRGSIFSAAQARAVRLEFRKRANAGGNPVRAYQGSFLRSRRVA